MYKSLYFTSPTQPHFIEVNNKNESKNTFKIYFSGNNLNLFKLENYKISSFNSFDNSYSVEVGANSSIYLEITPICGDVSVDAYVLCNIEREDKDFRETYKLVLALRKEEYSRNVLRYSNLPKKYNQFEKKDNSTFALLSTNPLLAGNSKLKIRSDGTVYFGLMEGLSQSNDSKLFHRRVKYGSDYLKEISSLFKDMTKEQDSFYKYYTKTKLDGNLVNNLANQYNDDVYMAGASYHNSKYDEEQYNIFAPCYFEDKIPSKFVIFRRDKFQDIEKKDLFKDLTIVKTFDLTNKSELGIFLNNTISVNNYNKSHIKTTISDNSVIAEITGIDPQSASVNTVYENLTDFIEDESTVINFERYLTETYTRRSMVSHRIINLEFLFDDVYDGFGSYFGMYVDDIDLDTFTLDMSKYEKNFYTKGYIGYNPKSNVVYSNSTIPLSDKFVNNNDRLFYFSHNDEYRNIVKTELENSKLKFILDKDIDFNKFTCSDSVLKIEKDRVVDNTNPYVVIEIDNLSVGSKLIFDSVKGKDYVFEITDTPITTNGYVEQGSEMIKSVNVFDNYVVVPAYVDLVDNHEITLYNNSNILGKYPIAYSVQQGENIYLYFSDSISLTNVTHIGFKTNNRIQYYIPYNADINKIIYDITTLLNNIDIPYTAICKDKSISVQNINNEEFTISIDFTKNNDLLSNVQHFGLPIIPNVYTVSNKSYTTNVVVVESTKRLNNEVYYRIDDYNKDFINNEYVIIGDNNESRVGTVYGDSFTITPVDLDGSVIKIKNDSISNRIIKPCLSKFGIFSIYETKDFDYNRIGKVFNYINEEYRLLYRNFDVDEKLIPRMIYSISNKGIENLHVQIKIGIEDSWKHTIVKDIFIAPNTIRDFSTFASDYDLNYYNENIEFRYVAVGGTNVQYSVYIKQVFEDPNLKEVDFEFPFSAYYNDGLDDFINKVKAEYGVYFPYLKNSRSEYLRLQEFSNTNSQIEDLVLSKYCKWGSVDFDSKNQPTRLNLSPAFGKTGYTSYLSNYKSDSSLHSHEWFILQEPPTHLSLHEGVEGQYLFTDVSKSLLLNENYDYFIEYFENGWPNVSKKQINIKLNKKQNYSILSRSGEGSYDTFFKGTNYRFNSAVNLSNYKFAIALSTRTELEELEGSLINHCAVEEVDAICKADGIFPQLMDTIDILEGGNKNLPLKISFINSGTTISINDDTIVTTGLDSNLYNSNEFFFDLDMALDKWEDVINKTYSTVNNWPYNLNMVFSENIEVGNFPVSNSYITDSQRNQYSIGNVRIGFADLQGNDIAKTYFVSKSDYMETNELMTPVILLNSRVFFRKNSDVASKEAYSLAYVIAHELGHVFGLGHNIKPNSIMNPSIKLNYNLSDLDYTSTRECLELIYGKYTPIIIKDEQSAFMCEKTRPRKQDSFDFIINKKFKTITLKMFVDVPNYLSLDSKKSYVEMYVSDSLKRIAKYGNTHLLEGLDLKIPSIDLSADSLHTVGNKLFANYKSTITFKAGSNSTNFLNEFNVGYNPLNSAYRIRRLEENFENYQIDYFSLDYTENFEKYKLNSSLDYSGSSNKALLQNISNNHDSSINVNLPVLSTGKFENSYMYRIQGGDSISNGNWKLTLDYLNDYSNSFNYWYSDNTTQRDFEVSILPIKQIKINNLKTPTLIDDNKIIYDIKNTKASGYIYRHESKFNPLFDAITYFGLREDYELSNLLGVDLYRCNTRLLWEHVNFGFFDRVVKKNSLTNIRKIEDLSISMYDKNIPILLNLRDIYSSPFDKNLYKLQRSEGNVIDLSGLYDVYLFKSQLNSILLNMPKTTELTLTSNYITHTIVNDNIEITFDYIDVLYDILYNYISPYYSNIYNIDSSEFKESLINLIINNYSNLYVVSDIELYINQNKDNVYVNSNIGLSKDINFKTTKKETKYTITKSKLTNLSTNIKLKFKYI